jgi:hypothetical protein
MPTPTDLVTDLPADFEVFGQAVDSSMADLLGGTTGQILAKNSNTNMDFVWIANDQGDITGITASSPLTGGGTSGAVTVGIQDGTTAQKGAVQLENSTSSTSTTTAAVPASVKSAYDLANGAIPKSLIDAAGDLIVGTAADTAGRLGIGTANQVLAVNSGGTALEWKTPAGGGGKVLQVVSTVLATTFSASGGSFTDVTDLSLSITPSSSSSKVLVFYNLALFVDGNLGFMNLVRDSTALSQGTASGSRTVATGGTPNYLNYAPTQAVAGNFLDSPATTSATTYKIQVYTSSGTVYVNRSAADDNQTNRPRFASVITAMEIGA